MSVHDSESFKVESKREEESTVADGISSVEDDGEIVKASGAGTEIGACSAAARGVDLGGLARLNCERCQSLKSKQKKESETHRLTCTKAGPALVGSAPRPLLNSPPLIPVKLFSSVVNCLAGLLGADERAEATLGSSLPHLSSTLRLLTAALVLAGLASASLLPTLPSFSSLHFSRSATIFDD